MKRLIKAIIRRFIWFGCWFLPIDSKKIVFSSYYGKGYGDNPKYIVEELLKQNRNFKIIWLVNDFCNNDSFPKEVIQCRKGSLKGIFHLTTAKIWVDNCRKAFFYKKKNQYYIQTWHGFALKRIEKDVEDKLGSDYVKGAISDSKAINLIISDSNFMTNIYRSSFWYNGQIVEWGSPRNDIIINGKCDHSIQNTIHKYYNIPEEHKIILYAPTFRATGSLEPYKIDIERVLDACCMKFSSKFVFLVRLHPNITEKSSELNFKWNDNIIDASKYPDMQALLCAADIVISDYSSLMFDFALSGKPCFQFATDIEDYKKDRNFYFQLDELPFSISKTTDELVIDILNFDEFSYNNKLNDFFEGVGMVRHGNASQKCVQLIDSICFPTKGT